MREKTVEQKLVKAVKSRGGICPKLVCPGFDGMPDRLVLLPDGKVGFVEVKAPGQKPRPLQVSRHNLLRSLGLQVFTLDDITAIQRMLDEIGGKHDNPSTYYEKQIEHYHQVIRELRAHAEKLAGLIREKELNRTAISHEAGQIGVITGRELR